MAEEQISAKSIQCELHSRLSVELYCHEHMTVFCRYCKAIKHIECDVKELRELCENTVLEGKLKSTVDQLTALQETTNNVLEKRRKEQDVIVNEIKEKRNTITRLQKELAALVVNYESQLQQHEAASMEQQEADVDACECIAEQVNDQLGLLEERDESCKAERLFLSLLKAKKVADDFESVLERIRNGTINRLPALQDEQASKVIQTVSSLLDSKENSSEEVDGNIHMTETPYASFWDIQSLTCVKQASTKTRTDGYVPEIKSCCFTSENQLCICDHKNTKLKVLDEDMNIKFELKVDGMPYDVAPFDEKTVIVTIPEQRLLQLVVIKPGVKIGTRLNINSMCFGIKIKNKKIHVCVSDRGQTAQGKSSVTGEFHGIRIYSEAGTFLSSIPLACRGNPSFLCLSADDSKIFYSGGCYSDAHVTCITKDGHGLYRHSEDMVVPDTVIVDDDDNVLVCDRSSKIVKVIQSGGIRSKNILSEKDKLDTPLSMCYNKTSKVLVVVCANSNEKTCQLRVFRLEFELNKQI